MSEVDSEWQGGGRLWRGNQEGVGKYGLHDPHSQSGLQFGWVPPQSAPSRSCSCQQAVNPTLSTEQPHSTRSSIK